MVPLLKFRRSIRLVRKTIPDVLCLGSIGIALVLTYLLSLRLQIFAEETKIMCVRPASPLVNLVKRRPTVKQSLRQLSAEHLLGAMTTVTRANLRSRVVSSANVLVRTNPVPSPKLQRLCLPWVRFAIDEFLLVSPPAMGKLTLFRLTTSKPRASTTCFPPNKSSPV